MTDELIISPNPILTELLLGEEDGGYVRRLFGLGLADDPIEPTAVHDPEPVLAVLGGRSDTDRTEWNRARQGNTFISPTPTGTIRIARFLAGPSAYPPEAGQ